MNQPDYTEPPCVVVLGMHRSGTSLLAGSLESAGLTLGEVNNAAPFNRKGNKENETIRCLNDTLLARGGFTWKEPPSFQVQWDHADQERAITLIEPYIRAALPWGFKDPRTIWTLEGWLRLLPKAHMIGVFRHPSLVVRSLVARSGSLSIEKDQALRLWCLYNSELIRLQRQYAFPIIQFKSGDALYEDFITPLTSFARRIGLSGPLERFFDRTLVHQVDPGPAPTDESRELYERLIKLSQLQS